MPYALVAGPAPAQLTAGLASGEVWIRATRARHGRGSTSDSHESSDLGEAGDVDDALGQMLAVPFSRAMGGSALPGGGPGAARGHPQETTNTALTTSAYRATASGFPDAGR